MSSIFKLKGHTRPVYYLYLYIYIYIKVEAYAESLPFVKLWSFNCLTCGSFLNKIMMMLTNNAIWHVTIGTHQIVRFPRVKEYKLAFKVYNNTLLHH
jgi:hypothetical protein